jgi:hypothetical protein
VEVTQGQEPPRLRGPDPGQDIEGAPADPRIVVFQEPRQDRHVRLDARAVGEALLGVGLDGHPLDRHQPGQGYKVPGGCVYNDRREGNVGVAALSPVASQTDAGMDSGAAWCLGAVVVLVLVSSLHGGERGPFEDLETPKGPSVMQATPQPDAEEVLQDGKILKEEPGRPVAATP